MHLQPLFEGFTYYPDEAGKSVSDKLFEYGLCLPSGLNMTTVKKRERDIGIVKEFLK